MTTPDPEGVSLARFLIASTSVLVLMGAFAVAMKKLYLRGWSFSRDLKNRRMKLVEILPLDARRRLVIFRCDDEEHLVLLGNESETLIKSSPASENKRENG